MKDDNALILNHACIARSVWKMELKTEIASEVKPGQFVQVEVPEYFLRRPISVCSHTDDSIVLVYRVSGDGTNVMSHMNAGEMIHIFGPLGNGYPLENSDVLLLGGGVGVPPLLDAAQAYAANGHKVTAVLGFNSKDDIILDEEFRRIGCTVFIATMDGSCGTKGTVMDAIEEHQVKEDYVLGCGPLPMLKSVSKTYTHGFLSLEARMACGIGACMGCVVKDTEGNSLRVCKDGPVFPIGKVAL